MADGPPHVALVTGASRGIGRAIAEALAERGALVICAGRTLVGVEDTARAIVAQGHRAIPALLDVSSFQEFQACAQQVAEEHGGVHILVNNAGITRDKLVVRMTEFDWDEVMNTNLKGCFNGVRAASPIMMRQRFGRIINISSIVATMGNPGQANYAAAKAGILGFTRSLARELASRNITVNAVAPGYIDTEMTQALPESTRQQLQQQIPLGRIGTPQDVAGVVAFLASADAAYITGQVIPVNGGMQM